jgi:single-strand DNA-binding protein
MGVNKVILQGNLTKDPDARTTTSGVSVTTFSIAVGRRFAKPDDEVKADFFTCVAWRGLADFVAKNFVKGKAIVVVGNLQNRSYTDSNGQKRYVTEVVAEECHFAGSKEQSADNNAENTAPINFEELSTDEELPF